AVAFRKGGERGGVGEFRISPAFGGNFRRAVNDPAAKPAAMIFRQQVPEIAEQAQQLVKAAVADPPDAGASFGRRPQACVQHPEGPGVVGSEFDDSGRSEEHTSELQSRENLVCRLLLEKKKKKKLSIKMNLVS